MPTVKVPSVTGQSDAAAHSQLEAVGLTVGPISADNSCQANPGIVTAQSPQAGGSAKEGDPVSLAESSGKTAQGTPCHPVVPNLFSDTDQGAKNALAAQGLVAGQVSMASSCLVDKGRVFEQGIDANTAVAPGTAVSFVESNGKDRSGKPCNVD